MKEQHFRHIEIISFVRLQKVYIVQHFKQFLLAVTGIFWLLLDVSPQGYFQQKVNYEIHVVLDDVKHELNGAETIEYFNNSPDTLGFLFFHLWPNAYSSNKTSLGKELFNRDGKSKLFNDPDLKGFIDSLNFSTAGRFLKWELVEGSPDICKLTLNESLCPGDSISIYTPFHVKLPSGVISRMGHVGESYQISQWYPKPAVYDRTGWHQMPYLDQGEFYSEYGCFDVSITLPSNYVVGATGNLLNEDERNWLDSLSSDTTWMIVPDYINDAFPRSSAETKTLRYTENNIHDFAWFADKRFHVLKGHVALPQSGRTVTTWAMFTNQEAYLWRKAISYINSALWYFSKWNGDYPYNSFTAVQSFLNAGSGMEYPSLTVVGLSYNHYFLDQVLAHEICHSWFYSAIGSDERIFPFLDESITSANESRYLELRYPGKKLWELELNNIKLAKLFHIENMPAERIQELDWIIPARNNMEQKINLPASEYSSNNYESIIYSKAAKGFNYLRAYLGDSLYDLAMHNYFRKWKNRHPNPADLKTVFESHTDKDLSWFFNDFISTTKRLDYKVAGVKDGKVLIRNKGELKAPVLISGMKNDTSIFNKWEDGFTGSKWVDFPAGDISEIRIDPDHKSTELYRLNNNIKTSGIFPRKDPVQIQLLFNIEDPDKRYILYFPSFGWTNSDGFMLGIALQNGTMLPKPVEYLVMPLFSFRENGLRGNGKIKINSLPYNGFIRLASLSFEGEQFGAPGNQNYSKGKIGLDLYLKSFKAINSLSQKVFAYYYTASDLLQIRSDMPAAMRSYLQFGYYIEKTRIINPYNLSATFESGKNYQKSMLELNFRYSYTGKKSGLDLRVFTGTMLKNTSQDQLFNFSASGRSGLEQYLFQGVYPGRFSEFPNSFWSRQMTLSEGSLVSPVNDSLRYSRWICSFSVSSSLPWKLSKIPVKPFANVVLTDNSPANSDKTTLFCEAGFKAGLWDFFEIYFPFIVSDNIKATNCSMKQRIRFILRLEKINSLKPKY